MPGQGAVLILALSLSLGAAAATAAPPGELRLLFTGDILLSRQVEQEWQRRGVSPWLKFDALFQSADWVGGNLEGALGDSADCLGSQSPCFAIRPALLAVASQAGFAALTQENNHAGDLGAAGRQATTAALAQAGVLGLSFDRSPQFFRRGDYTLALIAVNTVAGADGVVQPIPSIALAQKLRLARQLAQVVIVSVHWGQELVDWPVASQRAQAQWLVAQGADVIVGHHPHVVQPAACVGGKPVFWSLGNHLFDQKYPQSKQGAIADCRIAAGRLSCGLIATRTPAGTTYPQIVEVENAAPAIAQGEKALREIAQGVKAAENAGGEKAGLEIVGGEKAAPATAQGDTAAPAIAQGDKAALALEGCSVTLPSPLQLGGVAIRPEPWSTQTPPQTLALEGWRDGQRAWRSRRQRLLSLQQAPLAGQDQPPLLFALEQHASPLDAESGVRPYVYAVGPQGLVARWRGSALAWPLLDAVTVPSDNGALICALHRGDSFVSPDPGTTRRRYAAYRWNGFGFSGVEAPVAPDCVGYFGAR